MRDLFLRVSGDDVMNECTSSTSGREAEAPKAGTSGHEGPQPHMSPEEGAEAQRPAMLSAEQVHSYLHSALPRTGEQVADAPPTGKSQGVSDAAVRDLLAQATDSLDRELVALQGQDGGVLAEDARQVLLACIVRLYTMADIGKGFSVLIHILWTILEDQDARLDANSLRVVRDTLEHLHSNPRMSYSHARTLRKDLKRADLPVENREIRTLLVDAIMASRA